jgi:hypothetical protein
MATEEKKTFKPVQTGTPVEGVKFTDLPVTMAGKEPEVEVDHDVEYWRQLAEDKTMELHNLQELVKKALGRTEVQLYLDQLSRGIGARSTARVWGELYDATLGGTRFTDILAKGDAEGEAKRSPTNDKG